MASSIDWLKNAAKGKEVKQTGGTIKESVFKGRSGKRGPKKYHYTIEDMARHTGLAIQTLRNRAKEWNGSFDDTLSFILNNTKE
jgi:hypothetical protein